MAMNNGIKSASKLLASSQSLLSKSGGFLFLEIWVYSSR
ncbi:hypothetical protein SLEP1_g57966 [Rubroshorea leprosula]|uniref:Ribosomal protein L32 n=1 Tax=Rubroshorea leprosula TaxID=152421 RepID=A0AAV5MPE3_9ROSI|nr:hypothetical protein SLEP1_g57966 [Rubroshorea leprosula]